MRTAAGEVKKFFYSYVGYAASDCVEWPYARSSRGYGTIKINGATRSAHRVMCTIAQGEPPTPKHEVAHSCGNRPCINPNHLRWATSAENKADTELHGRRAKGERIGNSRFLAEEILAIRADRRTHQEISENYQTSRQYIGLIKSEKSWKHVQG